MAFFDQNRLDEIQNAIVTTIGYNRETRELLFANINPFYKNLLPSMANAIFQIMYDLDALNNQEKLSDGTVPFQLWLGQAARILRPFAEPSKIIQRALADIGQKSLKAERGADMMPPPQLTVQKIVQEKIIQRNDMVSYNFLEGGFIAGISVGLVQVPRYDNGNPKMLAANEPAHYLGTGWLLTNDLVITNHHVINARDDFEPDAEAADFILQGNNAVIRFDFNTRNAAGLIIKSVKLEAFDKNLDFAIFRLGAAVDRKPLRVLPEQVLMDEEHPQVLNIIQHPLGEAKKVALRNNYIYQSTYPNVSYFTDTDLGTSGAPVFDDSWRVIGLHRASRYVENVASNDGSTAWVNEGVQIKAIIDHLLANYPAVAAQITV